MALIDKSLFKFMLVGVVNTLIGASVMFILYNLFKINYWVSSASNYVLGSICSFFLNKYFTFKTHQWSVFMVAAFAAVILISYFLAYSISKPFINFLLKNSSQTFRENIALCTGMCIFTGLNYLGQRFFVFAENKD